MDEFDDGEPVIKAAPDLSHQRQGLLNRAYSEAGKNELLVTKLEAHVKPTTLARHRLYTQDYHYGFPLFDEAVDEALQNYLIKMGY